MAAAMSAGTGLRPMWACLAYDGDAGGLAAEAALAGRGGPEAAAGTGQREPG